MTSRATERIEAPHLFALVPFYEALPELRSCIRSLKAQTASFTAVLVDDGSSAASHEAARAAIGQDSRFILLRRETREGPAAARMTGLNHIWSQLAAPRDIVVLLDGDDRLIRDRALGMIRQVYLGVPKTRMTFGSSITHLGRRLFPDHYRPWQIGLDATHHLPGWHGDHPRSFRVGLFDESREALRLRFPSGSWLQGGTDIGLLLPMLRRCRPDEVVQIDATLYEYRSNRTDGRSLGRSSRGRSQQLLGEYYARGSLPFVLWKTLRHPRRSVWLGAVLLENLRARRDSQ